MRRLKVVKLQAITRGSAEWAEASFFPLFKRTNARRRELFLAIQRLLHCQAAGASLGQKDFSSKEMGAWVQSCLIEAGIAHCPDWDSWKPTGCDFRNAKARRFVPNWKLLLADIGPEVVCSFRHFLSGKSKERAPLHDLSDLLSVNSSCGVEIPQNVQRGFRQGTGLYCDFDTLLTLIPALAEDRRSGVLAAALNAVGRVAVEEIRPIWTQRECGRIYSKKPALVNMPNVLLPALRSVSGLPLWNIDFASFELRIAAVITGQGLGEEDAYQMIGNSAGIERTRVKRRVTAMLHGQTEPHLWFAEEKDTEAIADHPRVLKALRDTLPTLSDGIELLRRDAHLLQRRGAELFVSSLSAALDKAELQAMGLPKHDGCVFAATECQAYIVRDAFQAQAQEMTGAFFPVELSRIGNHEALAA